MNPLTLAGLATAFKVVSWLAGLPSMAMLLFYAFHTLRQRAATAAPATDFGPNPDAILLILKATTEVLGAAGRVLEAVGQIVLDLFAAAAGVGLVVALVCWGIGHGLQAQAAWARWSAFVLLSLLLLVTLVGALSLRDVGRVAMLAIVTLCVLALHTLWTGHGALHP